MTLKLQLKIVDFRQNIFEMSTAKLQLIVTVTFLTVALTNSLLLKTAQNHNCDAGTPNESKFEITCTVTREMLQDFNRNNFSAGFYISDQNNDRTVDSSEFPTYVRMAFEDFKKRNPNWYQCDSSEAELRAILDRNSDGQFDYNELMKLSYGEWFDFVDETAN